MTKSGACLLGAVVPAAGASRRMGKEKILLPFGRSTVLETVLDTLAAAAVGEVVVVLRPDLPEAAERARGRGARVVENRDPLAEMLVSIRLGLEALPPDLDAVFVWPADHPAVSLETARLLTRLTDPTRALIPVFESRRGHPVLIGRDLFPAIRGLSADGGLRQLWSGIPESVSEIEVEDAGVLVDLDTPEAYRKARAEKERWLAG